MGYWQHRRLHAEACAYLAKMIKPDIALLQEVCLPDLGPVENIVLKKD
jgi:hypothetical protein